MRETNRSERGGGGGAERGESTTLLRHSRFHS